MRVEDWVKMPLEGNAHLIVFAHRQHTPEPFPSKGSEIRSEIKPLQ